MTDTIPNVPRELLENLIDQHITAHGCTTETARQAQLMLSAPSPAGEGGWDVAGDILEKLSAAQLEIDQHARRIGELEGLLYEASGELRTDRHHGLGPRIDAALSAGKEGE